MYKNINNIRTLSVDMVEYAKSGHPGAPLGLAPFIYILYKDYLNIDPNNVNCEGRDIFILSNGHACAIQYVMNYLLGYLDMEDLKKFRQLESFTPGHPEGKSKGIEVSTGPLGQGVSNSVGFSISSKKLGLSNHIYCIFGDGCYMEGISQESFSIAANLKLDNLTFIYDFNHTTIDGSTDLSMNENVVLRFKSLGFFVIEADGEDINDIKKALDYKSTTTKVIILHTLIGRDSIVQNKNKAHGSPLGEEGVKLLKEKYGIPQIPFYISNELKEEWQEIRNKKINIEKKIYLIKKANVDTLNLYYTDTISEEKLATRKMFSMVLNDLKTKDQIICGSADLATSCLNRFDDYVNFSSSNRIGNYINFGIREHSMFGIANGISAHGYFIPIFSTFLNFVSYGFPSVRLGAFGKLNNVYVLTHDSIALGEDGPTHQPIEVLLTLRSTPNLYVMRPCDMRECRAALKACFLLTGPKAIILTRQKVSPIKDTSEKNCLKGAYYLQEHENPDFILLGTGSEIELCYKIIEVWKEKRISLVSFFSWELFEKQNDEYKKLILKPNVCKISIEASTTFGWHKYSDLQIGIDRFGWSGKSNEVYKAAGFSSDKIIEKIKIFLEK